MLRPIRKGPYVDDGPRGLSLVVCGPDLAGRQLRRPVVCVCSMPAVAASPEDQFHRPRPDRLHACGRGPNDSSKSPR